MHAYTVGLCIMQTGRVVYPHPYSGLVSHCGVTSHTPTTDTTSGLASLEHRWRVQYVRTVVPGVGTFSSLYTRARNTLRNPVSETLPSLHKHHHNVPPLLAILYTLQLFKTTLLFNLFQSSRIENIYGTSVDLYIFVVGVLFGNKYNLLAVVAVCT